MQYKTKSAKNKQILLMILRWKFWIIQVRHNYTIREVSRCAQSERSQSCFHGNTSLTTTEEHQQIVGKRNDLKYALK